MTNEVGGQMSLYKKSRLLLLGPILLIYLAFSFYKLDIRAVTDEGFHSMAAYTLITEGKIALPGLKGHPTAWDIIFFPYFIQTVLLAGTFKLFGIGLINGRLLSIFFGFITIISTYFLAKKLFNLKIALFSSALIATDNFIFLASRTIRPEIITTAFLLLAFLIYLKALENKKYSLFFLAGLFIGLGILAHPNMAIGAVAFLIIFALDFGLAGFVSNKFWLFVLGILSPTVPYLAYMVIMSYPDSISYIFNQFRLNNRLFPLSSSNWLFFSLKGEIFKRYATFIYFPFRAHIFMGLVFAILYSLVNRNKSNRYLLILIFTWIVSFWLLIVNKSVIYVVVFIPFLSILLASSIFNFFEKAPTASKKAPVFLMVFLILTQMAGNILFFYKYRGSEYGAFIAKLKQVIPKGASVYGPMTYWMGLKEHEYYAYEGVPFLLAKDTFKTKVYILGSRELVPKNPYEMSISRRNALREEMAVYFKSRGQFLGRVNNKFYGDIRIYKD